MTFAGLRSLFLTAAGIAAVIAAPASAAAQKTGLIVVAHGADSSWNAGVRRTIDSVKWAHGPVRSAFLMGAEATTASWNRAVAELQQAGVERIIAVPFMVSTHGSHVRQVEFYAGERAELPHELHAMMSSHGHEPHIKPLVPVHVTPALDDAPELGHALAARWNALSADDRKRPLMLIAHGPNDSADAVEWERNIMAVVGELSKRIAPHPVKVGLLRDDADSTVRANSVAAFRRDIAQMASAARDSVLVLPVLISTGSINRTKLPADIAGLPVRYTAVGLTPSASLAAWIGRIASEALVDVGSPPQERER